jgi:hypothetical protein
MIDLPLTPSQRSDYLLGGLTVLGFSSARN